MTIKTNLVTTTAGKTILKSTGNVLQSKFANFISTTQPLITSTSYVSTGISMNFTPLESTSKLYIRFVFNLTYGSTSGDGGCAIKLYRGGSPINPTNSADNFVYRATAVTGIHTPGKIIHYVPASTTNTTVFEIYQRSYDGESAAITGYWGTNSMMIMEIAA